MPINFYNSERILRLTPITEETKEIAEKIINCDVRVFPKLANVKVGRLDELWEMKFETSPSTYAIYVYALYPVSYLLNAYELSGSQKYLDKAFWLALSFLDWENKEDKKIADNRKGILFGDHAVSNRTQTLCYLTCCLEHEGYELPEMLLKALICNGKYLANSDNYSHYNHGLMMDLALLGLLNTLEGLHLNYPCGLKRNLLGRLQHSITRDLTEDGVHVENSPGYHFWMLGFLNRITPSLAGLDKHLYIQSKTALGQASLYAKYITRPDGSVPAIGDTHAAVRNSPSVGLASKYFQGANQVIFRNTDNTVWGHFSCGYKTHVHKHCDNGSFNLYCNGRDIFVDPGFLNYESSQQSLRIKSSDFHNLVKPRLSEQNIKRANLSGVDSDYSSDLSESKIISYECLHDVEFAKAKIADYSDGSIIRTVAWVQPNVFIIHDEADFSGEIRQIFNLAEDLYTCFSKGTTHVFDSKETLVCEIQQFSDSGELLIDSKVNVFKGYVADGLNSSKPNIRLAFDSCSGYFLTVVTLTGIGGFRKEDTTFDKLIEKNENLKMLFPFLDF